MSLEGLERALLMPQRPAASRRMAPRAGRFREPWDAICGWWKLPVLTAAPALVLASCVGSGQPMGERSLTLTPTEAIETLNSPEAQTAAPVAQNGAMHPPPADPTAGIPDSGAHPTDPSGEPASEPDAPVRAAEAVPQHATPRGGRRVSLRPIDNVHADDLLDHWGHRPSALLSGLLSQVQDPGEDAAQFEDLLEAARGVDSGTYVPGLQEGDTVTVLGHRRDVTCSRWSGGPADTLSIGFDLEHATEEIREDASFRAALERAGKVRQPAHRRHMAGVGAPGRRAQEPADRRPRCRRQGDSRRAGGRDQHRRGDLRDRCRAG